MAEQLEVPCPHDWGYTAPCDRIAGAFHFPAEHVLCLVDFHLRGRVGPWYDRARVAVLDRSDAPSIMHAVRDVAEHTMAQHRVAQRRHSAGELVFRDRAWQHTPGPEAHS